MVYSIVSLYDLAPSPRSTFSLNVNVQRTRVSALTLELKDYVPVRNGACYVAQMTMLQGYNPACTYLVRTYSDRKLRGYKAFENGRHPAHISLIWKYLVSLMGFSVSCLLTCEEISLPVNRRVSACVLGIYRGTEASLPKVVDFNCGRIDLYRCARCEEPKQGTTLPRRPCVSAYRHGDLRGLEMLLAP